MSNVYRNRKCSWGSTSEIYPTRSEKGKQRVLPRSVIRKIQHESSAGGRGRCCKCDTAFSMQYLRFCVTGPFASDYVCVDCKSEFNLQLARR